MSSSSFKNGANAGREGRDPSPPNFGPLSKMLFGISDEAATQAEKDYKDGYAAGSQQRAADARDDDDD